MELSASKIPRIEVVDALRGFAVMAIILVHNLEHFIFPVYPTEQPAWLAVLNDGGWINNIIAVIKIALSLHLRTRNKTKPTTANNNSTSPAGKKAAFKVAKPSNRTNRHKKR